MPAASERCAERVWGRPRGNLSVVDGVAVLLGVVIGIGIFGFPPLVAQHAATPLHYMGLWVAGGAVMLMGALCYAELGSSYPHAGGEYHFLRRAWGGGASVLFAWARGSVIQTGSIAAVAFIHGQYAQTLLPLGEHGVALHGALAVACLTLLNVVGTRPSKRLQLLFTSLTLIAIGGMVAAVVVVASPGAAAPEVGDSSLASGNVAGMLGMGMVFVLLTYGGWNEAAYLSGELREPGRNMSRVLLLGTAVVSLVYVLVNLAYLWIFSLEGLRASRAVGAELMAIVAGPRAAVLLSLVVCLAALSTINATILTGARVYYALGRDVPRLALLGDWDERGATPRRALLVQGVITLALVAFGAVASDGIAAMVAYTAPVFWLFMLLTVLALIRLRRREPSRPRPFRVPFYPLIPLLFAAACVGLLWSSILYAGPGAIVGLLILAAGLPLLWMRGKPAERERC